MNDYMKEAFYESLKALRKKEIPVGAVIVKDNKVIAKAYNDRQKHYKVTGHAEINCILKAEKKLKDWRLNGCEMYVTLEPCNMCKYIIKESRIDNAYYLLSREKHEDDILLKIKNIQKINNKQMLEDYEKILKNFFEDLRD